MNEFTFPIYARFQYNKVSFTHVPKRKSREFEENMGQTVSVTLDELVQFMQDPSIQEWETVVMHLSLTEIRRMLSFGFVDALLFEIPTHRHKIMGILRDGLHIRLTPKDLQGGMERMRPRIRIEMFKDRVFHSFVRFQQELGLRREFRTLIEDESFNWDKVAHFIEYEILKTSATKSEGKSRIQEVVLTFYDFLFYHEESSLIEHWLKKMRTQVDDNLAWLEETLVEWVPTYLSAQAQSGVRKLVGTVHTTSLQDELIQTLQKQNQEQQETIDMLLSVIESLSPKHRPDEGISDIPVLRGERILVIGDSGHRSAYRALVEARGGAFDFLEGFEKDGRTDSKMASADGILFVTAYSSHKKFYALKAEKQFHKCVLVNQAGLGEFERGLETLVQRMQSVELDVAR